MWKNTIKTAKGLALEQKFLNGDITLKITKAVAGAGRVDPNQLFNQAEVSKPFQNLELGAISRPREDRSVILPIKLQNTGLQERHTLQQIGIYAEDPIIGEILYIISQISDENGRGIPSWEESPSYVMQWNFSISSSNTEQVQVTVDQAGLLSADEGDARYVLQRSLLEMTYPVGAIYMSVLSTNPATLFGGSWERIARGAAVIGVDESDMTINAAEKSVGKNSISLTPGQMPAHTHASAAHTHSFTLYAWNMTSNTGGRGLIGSITSGGDSPSARSVSSTTPGETGSSGSGSPLDVRQLSLSVYIWKRTA